MSVFTTTKKVSDDMLNDTIDVCLQTIYEFCECIYVCDGCSYPEVLDGQYTRQSYQCILCEEVYCENCVKTVSDQDMIEAMNEKYGKSTTLCNECYRDFAHDVQNRIMCGISYDSVDESDSPDEIDILSYDDYEDEIHV